MTKLDLRNAYHLVRIREGDECKIAFNILDDHYEYLVMSFGFTNASALFQALVNIIPRDFLNRFVFAYLDDILVYSSYLATHTSDTFVRYCRSSSATSISSKLGV